eukprot:287213-Prorocentrum_minimum.AAC.2
MRCTPAPERARFSLRSVAPGATGSARGPHNQAQAATAFSVSPASTSQLGPNCSTLPLGPLPRLASAPALLESHNCFG